jgi:propionyl-CoA:succinyl-CoA transferase
MLVSYPVLSPEEAAELIEDGQTVAFSGFTPAGSAKAVPAAIAKKAKRLHQQNRPFKIRVLSGASTGKLDDLLGEAEAISWRAPYQSSGPLRQLINQEKVNYLDIHLSHMSQMTSYGFFGDIDYAVIEATEITRDGRVYLSTSIGASPVYMRDAKNVIIELNHYHSPRLNEMADIIAYPKPPHRNYFIAIQQPTDKIGAPYMAIDPKKIVAVVHNNEPDGIPTLDSPDNFSEAIAEHIEKFMLNELKTGCIPPEFLPLQAGVGNMANAVLLSLGKHPEPHGAGKAETSQCMQPYRQ